MNRITKTLLHFRAYAYGKGYPGVVECEQPHSFDLTDEDAHVILKGLETLTLLGAMDYAPYHLVANGIRTITEEDVRWANNITKLQKVAKRIMGNDGNDKTGSD